MYANYFFTADILSCQKSKSLTCLPDATADSKLLFSSIRTAMFFDDEQYQLHMHNVGNAFEDVSPTDKSIPGVPDLLGFVDLESPLPPLLGTVFNDEGNLMIESIEYDKLLDQSHYWRLDHSGGINVFPDDSFY